MNKRNLSGNKVLDPSFIANNQYNEASGAQKQVDVGPKLLPLTIVTAGVESKTTAATTIVPLPSKGRSLAVYNNAGAVGSITLGQDATQASKAVGVVDATTGAVGIPCKPNDWTYISCGNDSFVIASAATLLVFLIDDDTKIAPQTR